MSEAGKCVKQVWPVGAWYGHPCAKAGKVEHDGKWYCGIHSPEAEAKRKAVSDEKYRQYREEQDAKYAREAYNEKAGDACRALGIDDPGTLLTEWTKAGAP